MEPKYAFSIPSIHDDTPLDCRLYYEVSYLRGSTKANSPVKGAVIAHPYAPLGGSYDDRVVLSVAETLVNLGYVVGTFNFRGAGESAGKTTWTGKAETQEFISFVGFMIYYLQHVRPTEESSGLQTVFSMSGAVDERPDPFQSANFDDVKLTIGGYSYGSLVLARFPPTSEIITQFETAERGTSAAEIVLRARTLTKQTSQMLQEQQSPTNPRGRQLDPADLQTSPTKRMGASPMTMGGEETDPSERRRSRDSRRSIDVMRKSVEIPHRIKDRIKHRHSSYEKAESPKTPIMPRGAPTVITRYLLISPVLLPFSDHLLPPGAQTWAHSSGKADAGSDRQFLLNPTLAVFGTNDGFTASKRLKRWAEKQDNDTSSDFQWSAIETAGHFWREESVLQALQQRIVRWAKEKR